MWLSQDGCIDWGVFGGFVATAPSSLRLGGKCIHNSTDLAPLPIAHLSWASVFAHSRVPFSPWRTLSIIQS
ncbi:hypothetical protein A0H81_10455 [Grifola frondosa]|uniref:Uncharacterized protein n=1 Tax=Grifola frondosa TaxID=5627 RepID=A0A1C7LZQ1_GRIFR|nr:hypothetical protein A0H81_10455 [Grifola frondosa]